MNTIKTVSTRPSFQGDLMLVKVSAIPSGFEEDTTPEALIIAHSETGHHHKVHKDGGDSDVALKERPQVRVFRSKTDPFTAFLEVAEPATVVHHRDYATHDTLKLPVGIFRIGRQREYSPFGERMVQD